MVIKIHTDSIDNYYIRSMGFKSQKGSGYSRSVGKTLIFYMKVRQFKILLSQYLCDSLDAIQFL